MIKPPMPNDAMLDVAILWLENNEGSEANACRKVAEWLDYEKQERFLRAAAYKAGIPVARLRRKLAEKAKATT